MIFNNKTELIDFLADKITFENKYFYSAEFRPYLNEIGEENPSDINNYFKSDLQDLDIKEICELFAFNVFSEYTIIHNQVIVKLR